jgi:hypothetical protein
LKDRLGRAKTKNKFFVLLFSRLFVTLAVAQVTDTRKIKEKFCFSLLFARLIVTLASAEVTPSRQSKSKKQVFRFALLSTFRNFARF